MVVAVCDPVETHDNASPKTMLCCRFNKKTPIVNTIGVFHITGDGLSSVSTKTFLLLYQKSSSRLYQV